MMRSQKKNYLHACLFLFVVLSFFTACKGFVDNEVSGSGDVSFSFRTINEVVDSVLSVTISDGSNLIALQERKISASDDVVKIDFDGLAVGKKVTISATLIKDNAVLYKGSENIVVEKGDNKVSLGLKRASVSLNLKPIDLPLSDLEGAVFKVSINGKAKSPIIIEPGADFVSMDIGYVSIGNEILIEASIEKDRTEWYKISKKHVVQESDSEIILNMEERVVDLSVAPGDNINVNNYLGKKFRVYVDGKLVGENEIQVNTPVSIPLGIHSIGDNIKIRAAIEWDRNVRLPDYDVGMVEIQKLCEWSGLYNVKKGENIFLADMDLNSGTVLFDGHRVKVHYADLTSSIDDSFMDGAFEGISNFCFGPDKDVWGIKKDDTGGANSEIVNLPHGFRQGDNPRNYKVVDGLRLDSIIDIDYYDNGVLVVDGSGSVMKLTKSTGDLLNREVFTINPPTLTDMVGGASIRNIAVSGNNIYAAFVNNGGETVVANTHVKIFKGSVESSGITFTDNALFDSKTYKDGGSAIFSDLTLVVTDMLVQDGDLYVLLCDNGVFQEPSGESNNSRGALVKIGANGSTQVVGFHNSKVAPDVNGYMINETAESHILLSKFVGPRKFIAIKPKELVIADSGATYESEYSKYHKKRVVTVNLEGMTFSYVDINSESMFGGNVSGYYQSGLY